MSYENKNFGENRNNEAIFSKRIKAGKRRTYFFDVRTTRGNDYFITITESKNALMIMAMIGIKCSYIKEDFNKFIVALNDTVDHVKTELMPDFDFDAFNHDQDEEYQHNKPAAVQSEQPVEEPVVEDVPALPPVVSSVVDAATQEDNTSVEDWKI